MAKALSQEEIDALLNNVFTGEDAKPVEDKTRKKVTIYDFKHPNLISKDQMRLLEKIHEGLVRNFSVFLSVQLRTIVEVNLLAIDQINYSEFVMSISTPGAIYVGAIDDPYSQFVLEISPQLIIFIVEKLFGGQGNFVSTSRTISVIERRVMKRVVDHTVKEISKQWSSLKEFQTKIQRFESNPEFVQIVPANEPVVVVSMEIEVKGNTTMMNLCYPYTWISKIISSTDLTDKVLFDTPDTKEHDKLMVLENMNKTRVTFQTRLGCARIPMRDILQLEVGDVLKLDTEVTDPVYGYAANKKLYRGSIGKIGKKYGIKIQQILKGEDEDE